MKKIKMVFLLIVIGLVGLVAYQNWPFLADKHSFGVNLIFKSYQSPPVSNILVLIVFFFIGLVLAYFSALTGQFKSRRTINNLKQQLALHKEKNSDLEKQLNAVMAEASAKVDVAATPSDDT